MVHYSALRKRGRNLITGYNVDEPQNIKLNELSQSDKDKFCMIPLKGGV